jgi:arylsulfatase A
MGDAGLRRQLSSHAELPVGFRCLIATVCDRKTNNCLEVDGFTHEAEIPLPDMRLLAFWSTVAKRLVGTLILSEWRSVADETGVDQVAVPGLRVMLLLLVFFYSCLSPLGAATSTRPSIVFILADDLGYGDIGSFGQKKIRTPNLDRMAREGRRLTQHYSGNAVCAPSRCVLMTGQHPGHAFIRDNREIQPEGNQPLPAGTATLASLLKQNGYATAAIGKWGLGPPNSEGDPQKQGFDRFFGYKCQRHAHNHYPTYLWRNDQRLILDNPAITLHERLPGNADPKQAGTYSAFSGKTYAPDLMYKEALAFIDTSKALPFFLYYATTVPHLALQVPEDSVAAYAGKWPDPPYTGGKRYLPHRTPRAAYAAMISRLDRDIGDIMRHIQELDLDERTIFIFSSDNGPLFDKHGGTDTEFFNSAAGLRGRKGSLYEGGIRVPTIIRWKGHINPGTTSDRVSGFEDWLPTLLDLAGLASVTPKELDGISFAPTLLGKGQEPRPFLYREFPNSGGWQSVRVGDWKAVLRNLHPERRAKEGSIHTELYDLKNDPAETADVSAQHPEVVAKLEEIMRQQHTRSELFPMRALDDPQ